MKIEQNRIDDLNLELTLTVTKEDYAENKKKRLNEYSTASLTCAINIPLSLWYKYSTQYVP